MDPLALRPMSSLCAVAALLCACALPETQSGTDEVDMIVSSQQAPLAATYPAGTSASQVVYTSLGSDGSLVDSSGLIVVPPGSPPPGGWPVVAWGHGTTGIGDDCAPSRVPGAYYEGLLADFLTSGYAIVAPDYIGLGTPGTHPYLIADSAARATLDMVAAALGSDFDLSDEWVIIGHSQGGQAAWAVAEAVAANPVNPVGSHRGSIAIAPAPNFSPGVEDLVSSDPLIQQFNLMTLVGLSTYYDIDFDDYLSKKAQQAISAVETLCFDDLTRDINERDLTKSDFEFRSEAAKVQLRERLVPHEIGSKPVALPLLVMQGGADKVVGADLTREMVSAANVRDAGIDYTEFPAADHGSVLTAMLPTVRQWLTQRFAS